ncbi:hypothetical protein CIB48_g11955 [Xylaria polymorpha]|nr:hypothetical protein CIB48_g11955 [Xylaria polymorpha]
MVSRPHFMPRDGAIQLAKTPLTRFIAAIMPSRNAQKAAIPKATTFSFALYAWASLGLAQPKPGRLSTHNRRCAELNWGMLMCATFSAALT